MAFSFWLAIIAIKIESIHSLGGHKLTAPVGRFMASKTRIQAQVEDDDISMEGFRARKKQQEENAKSSVNDLASFDGYAMRDAIIEKWGRCFDVDFNRVDSFGFKNLYLNVLPFYLGGRRFRHDTELDYLCHLQAVVEILRKYDQLEYVLAQISEINRKPKGGTSPSAVPLRLDLSRQQVEDILGY